MADYLDFPDIFSRFPNWSFILVLIGVFGIVIKLFLKSVKAVITLACCLLMVYLLVNLF